MTAGQEVDNDLNGVEGDDKTPLPWRWVRVRARTVIGGPRSSRTILGVAVSPYRNFLHPSAHVASRSLTIGSCCPRLAGTTVGPFEHNRCSEQVRSAL